MFPWQLSCEHMASKGNAGFSGAAMEGLLKSGAALASAAQAESCRKRISAWNEAILGVLAGCDCRYNYH